MGYFRLSNTERVMHHPVARTGCQGLPSCAAADACVLCRCDKMFQTIRNFSELHASFHQDGQFSMLDATEEFCE